MFNSVSLTLYFNSRPHGGRHSHGAGIGSSFCISTHALTEGDVDKVPIIPTPSISTHALTEGDSFQKPPEALKRSFQLTPSRRATLLRNSAFSILLFQLTPSRRATILCRLCSKRVCISTHALTEGDDRKVRAVRDCEFQLTPSRRATHPVPGLCRQVVDFNSRPHGGRHSGRNGGRYSRNFNSRPHGGRRTIARL